MGKTCPNCYHVNDADAKRCDQCGWRLYEGYESEAPEQSYSESAEDEEYYYTYEWFGTKISITEWRWNLGIIAGVVMMLLLALVYAALGLYVNTILFLVFAAVTGWITHVIGRDKWRYISVLLVGFFVILPLLLVACFPWQPWLEEQEAIYNAPRFVDHLSYTVDGTHIVVDGYVVNEGRTAGYATIEISAWGGMWEEGQDPMGGFQYGYVSTGLVQPHGGKADVHWECTLGYFNAYGQVGWHITSVTAAT